MPTSRRGTVWLKGSRSTALVRSTFSVVCLAARLSDFRLTGNYAPRISGDHAKHQARLYPRSRAEHNAKGSKSSIETHGKVMPLLVPLRPYLRLRSDAHQKSISWVILVLPGAEAFHKLHTASQRGQPIKDTATSYPYSYEVVSSAQCHLSRILPATPASQAHLVMLAANTRSMQGCRAQPRDTDVNVSQIRHIYLHD